MRRSEHCLVRDGVSRPGVFLHRVLSVHFVQSGHLPGIRFCVQGDIGTGNVMLKPREAEKPEDKVTLTVHEPVTAIFALRYLVNFSKAAPLCGVVELYLGPDAPFLVEYD